MGENENIEQTTASIETDSHAHNYDHFYQDPAFWVGLSFVIVVVCLAKPLYKIAQTLLDKRIKAIKDTLKEAKQLELDSKRLLQEYEAKMANLEQEVKDILDKSKKEIDFIKSKNIKDLEDELKRKKQDNEYFISNLKKQAQKEITEIISKKVISAIKNTAAEDLEDKDYDKLIDAAIKNVENLGKKAK
ncbi:MAG: hypothetical protein LBR70_06065 [Lactobacillaceae bacterium]|jgi:F-type H+-transporting ATPase subunit b|nr:hypothetical protein [Lactobacillaceae bacterium]